MSIRVLPVAGLVALTLLAAPAARANLVTNGGFETSPALSGWTLGGTGIAADSAQAHSGSNDAAFTALSTDTSPGTLSQLIGTTAGQSYTLSFWLLDQNVLPGAETFNVSFGGFTDAIAGSSLTAATYTNLVLTVPGSAVTGISTNLSFQGLQDGTTFSPIFNLDDVVLTANASNIPEPAGATLLGAGALLMLAVAARRGRGAILPPRG